MDLPHIVSRKSTAVSPYVTLLEKQVCFREGGPIKVYHSVTQADYVSIFAITADRQVPIVRQYRPAVEAFTWEFPAGSVDAGEDPRACAERELFEETGMRVDEIHALGAYYPDTGRLSVGSTAFFARGRRDDEAVPESGIQVRYVTVAELADMVRSGEFKHQLHVALIASAMLHGHISYNDLVHCGPSQVAASPPGHTRL